jgi:hypothetical protein
MANARMYDERATIPLRRIASLSKGCIVAKYAIFYFVYLSSVKYRHGCCSHEFFLFWFGSDK